MTPDIAGMSAQEKFKHLFAVISGQRFLKKEGLGNEVPFFICPFRPEDSVEMEQHRRQLVNSLENAGVRVLEINLYDLSIEILKKRGIWDGVLEMEESVSKEQLKELLQGVLDSEAHLVPAIAASLAYQFGLEWGAVRSRSFRFVVIDEAFGRGSDESARYGLKLFALLNLQLLIVTPLQKIHIIEPFVSSVGFVHNEDGRSSVLRNLSIEEYRAERQRMRG